ncbi:hypothetical protein PR048_017677 [Dryococelus australis]|uniref:Uncharacterized protein n=1 Tax=Dryococelus australis TaxID=614101 RepID=A0ABQ9HAA0_9NEOP|nr:hypothetical protein PR048_017677 [Dryococelus australis]
MRDALDWTPNRSHQVRPGFMTWYLLGYFAVPHAILPLPPTLHLPVVTLPLSGSSSSAQPRLHLPGLSPNTSASTTQGPLPKCYSCNRTWTLHIPMGGRRRATRPTPTCPSIKMPLSGSKYTASQTTTTLNQTSGT